jgi:hypothetical protein
LFEKMKSNMLFQSLVSPVMEYCRSEKTIQFESPDLSHQKWIPEKCMSWAPNVSFEQLSISNCCSVWTLQWNGDPRLRSNSRSCEGLRVQQPTSAHGRVRLLLDEVLGRHDPAKERTHWKCLGGVRINSGFLDASFVCPGSQC